MALRIGVVGAGIGGLAAAALLHDRGHHVTLIERFSRARPLGSGLVIQPVGQEVLAAIGALEAASRHGAWVDHMHGIEVEHGRRVLDVSYGTEHGLAIHRAALFDALFGAVSRRGLTLRTGAEVTRLELTPDPAPWARPPCTRTGPQQDTRPVLGPGAAAAGPGVPSTRPEHTGASPAHPGPNEPGPIRSGPHPFGRTNATALRGTGFQTSGTQPIGTPALEGRDTDALPPAALCTSSQTPAARLHLTDGPPLGPFDLVVDASGAGSQLSPLDARPLPFGAIWGTVDWPDATDLPPNRLSQRYRRADRMIGILPIGRPPGASRPQAALFWSLPRGSHPDWCARGLPAWRAEAKALWPALTPFIDQIEAPEQMTLAEYSHGTLRRPYGAACVHIGDAAHRASPQLGQGANMALLDAMALARALDRHPHDTGEALRSYAAARRWHTRIYQAMSAAFTPQYQSDSRVLPVLRDRILFPISQIPPLPRLLTALVTGRMLPPLGSLTPPR